MRWPLLVGLFLTACGGSERGGGRTVAAGADTGVFVTDAQDGASPDAAETPDSGRIDCSANPRGCAWMELRAADCSCLGICASGWTWDPGTRSCLAPPDSGVVDTGVTGFDAEPALDATALDATALDATPFADAAPGLDAQAGPDAGPPPPTDAGTPAFDAGPRDGGAIGAGMLGASCAQDSDCASTVCLNIASAGGARCVRACGRSTDCPSGFTCHDLDGARICLSAQDYGGGASFTQAAGTACSSGGTCRSNFCPAQTSCVETCASPADCGGAECVYTPVGDDLVAACTPPPGAGAHGATCATGSDCASGLCVGATCSRLCGTTAQCASGEICGSVNASTCLLDLGGICLQYEPNVVTACIPATHGADPVGAPCTDYVNCRGGLCYLTYSLCTDTCTADSHCPPTFRCKVAEYGSLDDGSTIYINVCAPE